MNPQDYIIKKRIANYILLNASSIAHIDKPPRRHLRYYQGDYIYTTVDAHGLDFQMDAIFAFQPIVMHITRLLLRWLLFDIQSFLFALLMKEETIYIDNSTQ